MQLSDPAIVLALLLCLLLCESQGLPKPELHIDVGLSAHEQVTCRFKDKEVQKDAKMVSYNVVDKSAKPYVEVEVGGEKKVSSFQFTRADRLPQCRSRL